MTVSELIKALEALNEPDLPVIVTGSDNEIMFLDPKWVQVIDDDGYSHAFDENWNYLPIGRAVRL